MILNCGRYKLDLSSHTHIMGILNATPDSFYDGGIYYEPRKAVERGLKLEEDGADIIDIGGESARPGSKPVPPEEEIRRIIPIIKKIVKRVKIPVSVDTYKSEVAKAALDNGASLVNDITGLRDEKMAALIKKYNAGVVLMHIKGTPLDMQDNPKYKNLISEIITSLRNSIDKALKSGIKKSHIIIDPGIGFGKTARHNLQILNKLKLFKSLGFPVLIGPSRKSFIGAILNIDAKERIYGTAATVCSGIYNGADIIRVHDVKAMSQIARMMDAIKNA